jgi:hypothetical protein
MDALLILREQWESLLATLPRGFDLEKTLRESGALVRRREIRSAEVLLRLLLVYSLCGLSLRSTAAWAQAHGVAEVSDVALLKRLRKAAPWVGQLLGAELAERAGQTPRPMAYRLRLVDATTASAPGSKGTDYRVHLGFDLASFQVDRIEVTGAQGGESYSRLEIGPGDLILADRGYCHRAGLAAVRQAGADFLVRINWQNLPLQDSQQQRLDLVDLLEQVRGPEAMEFEVTTVADKRRGLAALPVRLIAARKPEQAVQAELRRIHRESSRKGRKADPRTLRAAAYFFVLTSVSSQELSAQQALDLYRLRWQIEMTFKRIKGLLHLGELPVKDPQLAHGYLCAKLLAALMLEDLTKDFLAFSPSGSGGSVEARVPVESPANPARSPVLRVVGDAEPLPTHPQSLRDDAPLLRFSESSRQASPPSCPKSSSAWRAKLS